MPGLKATIEEIAEAAARAADDKRAENVVVLDLRGLSIMADYFVIAEGSSEVQVRAIAEGVREDLQQLGVGVLRREGWEDARWVLLDYGDVVVHIFQSDDREYYGLERLWGDAPRQRFDGEEDRLVEVEF